MRVVQEVPTQLDSVTRQWRGRGIGVGPERVQGSAADGTPGGAAQDITDVGCDHDVEPQCPGTNTAGIVACPPEDGVRGERWRCCRGAPGPSWVEAARCWRATAPYPSLVTDWPIGPSWQLEGS